MKLKDFTHAIKKQLNFSNGNQNFLGKILQRYIQDLRMVEKNKKILAISL